MLKHTLMFIKLHPNYFHISVPNYTILEQVKARRLPGDAIQEFLDEAPVFYPTEEVFLCMSFIIVDLQSMTGKNCGL